MQPNPHTYGTISWARIHLANAPGGCNVQKDCPDCAYANREVIKAAEADRRVLAQSIEGTGEKPPAPPKVRL